MIIIIVVQITRERLRAITIATRFVLVLWRKTISVLFLTLLRPNKHCQASSWTRLHPSLDRVYNKVSFIAISFVTRYTFLMLFFAVFAADVREGDRGRADQFQRRGNTGNDCDCWFRETRHLMIDVIVVAGLQRLTTLRMLSSFVFL
jgi:hypothetical protein